VTSTSYNDVNEERALGYPGQYYNPDEQCRMIWGPKSYLCRVSDHAMFSHDTVVYKKHTPFVSKMNAKEPIAN